MEAAKHRIETVKEQVVVEFFRKTIEKNKDRDRPRQLYTELGLLDIKRDYYYNKQQQCYETPLDEVLGIRAYEHNRSVNFVIRDFCSFDLHRHSL